MIEPGVRVSWVPQKGRLRRSGTVDNINLHSGFAVVKHRITERGGKSRLTYSRVRITHLTEEPPR